MSEAVSVAEATLIAQDAAKKALHEHAETLPLLMKPVMYEVAETVARRQKADMHNLFTVVFGADVTDTDHVRDLHKDLFYLRDQRVGHEARKAVQRQEAWRAFFKLIGQGMAAAIIALGMLLGLNINLPKGQ